MKKFDILTIINVLKKKQHKVFDGKPFMLNIIGIRSIENKPDKFDDMLVVFFRDVDHKWKIFHYAITTDPGLYWLKNPLNVIGTAILAEGQYENCYKIGLHKQQYNALVQCDDVTVHRDADRDAEFDLDKIEVGMFGLNIHKASDLESVFVSKWSAGCQVFKIGENFRDFMQVCEKARKLHGNKFTYTLLNEKDFLVNGSNSTTK